MELRMSDNLFGKLFRRGRHLRTKELGRPRRARLAIEPLEERLLLDAGLLGGDPRALLDNPALVSLIGTPSHTLAANQTARSRARAGGASIVATAVNDTTILLRFPQKLGRGAVNPASYQIPG